jgi:hypothetical protein
MNRSASPGRLRAPSASLLVVGIRRVLLFLSPRVRGSSLGQGSVRTCEMRSSVRRGEPAGSTELNTTEFNY